MGNIFEEMGKLNFPKQNTNYNFIEVNNNSHISSNPDLYDSRYNSSITNFINKFLNSKNQASAGTYSGEIIKYDISNLKSQQELNKLQEAFKYATPDEKSVLENRIGQLNSRISENKSKIDSLVKDFQDIAPMRYISKDYEIRELKESNWENSSVADYWKSGEAAQDLGSSFGFWKYQAGSIIIPQLAKWLVQKSARNFIAGMASGADEATLGIGAVVGEAEAVGETAYKAVKLISSLAAIGAS